MHEIDTKDRKLLYYLSQNARISNTQLSKKIQLSKNAVKYRIDRLKKLGIINHFAAIVNLGAIDLCTFTLLLKFNEDIYEKPEIIDYFKQHPLVDWAVTLSGEYDLFVEIVSKDLIQLTNTIDEITEKFKESLNTYRLFWAKEILRVEHLVEDFYKDLELPQLPRKPRTPKSYNINQTDKKILYLLNQDSSLPFLSIAKKLDLTIDIVRYRIKSMIDKGIIVKTFPDISLKKLGYTIYIFTLQLKNVSHEQMNKLQQKVQNHTSVTYSFVDITSYNIIIVCAFKTTDQLDHFSRSLRKDYADIIDKQEIFIIKEEVLFNLFPKGLLTI